MVPSVDQLERTWYSMASTHCEGRGVAGCVISGCTACDGAPATSVNSVNSKRDSLPSQHVGSDVVPENSSEFQKTRCDSSSDECEDMLHTSPDSVGSQSGLQEGVEVTTYDISFVYEMSLPHYLESL